MSKIVLILIYNYRGGPQLVAGPGGVKPAVLLGGFNSALAGLPYDRKCPEQYTAFTRSNVSMSKEKGCEGLMDISLCKLCPEIYFHQFIECLKCWLKNTLGEQGPYHLHKIDISYNNLSNA